MSLKQYINENQIEVDVLQRDFYDLMKKYDQNQVENYLQTIQIYNLLEKQHFDSPKSIFQYLQKRSSEILSSYTTPTNNVNRKLHSLLQKRQIKDTKLPYNNQNSQNNEQQQIWNDINNLRRDVEYLTQKIESKQSVGEIRLQSSNDNRAPSQNDNGSFGFNSLNKPLTPQDLTTYKPQQHLRNPMEQNWKDAETVQKLQPDYYGENNSNRLNTPNQNQRALDSEINPLYDSIERQTNEDRGRNHRNAANNNDPFTFFSPNNERFQKNSLKNQRFLSPPAHQINHDNQNNYSEFNYPRESPFRDDSNVAYHYSSTENLKRKFKSSQKSSQNQNTEYKRDGVTLKITESPPPPSQYLLQRHRKKKSVPRHLNDTEIRKAFEMMKEDQENYQRRLRHEELQAEYEKQQNHHSKVNRDNRQIFPNQFASPSSQDQHPQFYVESIDKAQFKKKSSTPQAQQQQYQSQQPQSQRVGSKNVRPQNNIRQAQRLDNQNENNHSGGWKSVQSRNKEQIERDKFSYLQKMKQSRIMEEQQQFYTQEEDEYENARNQREKKVANGKFSFSDNRKLNNEMQGYLENEYIQGEQNEQQQMEQNRRVAAQRYQDLADENQINNSTSHFRQLNTAGDQLQDAQLQQLRKRFGDRESYTLQEDKNILEIANSFLSSPIMRHFNIDRDTQEDIKEVQSDLYNSNSPHEYPQRVTNSLGIQSRQQPSWNESLNPRQLQQYQYSDQDDKSQDIQKQISELKKQQIMKEISSRQSSVSVNNNNNNGNTNGNNQDDDFEPIDEQVSKFLRNEIKEPLQQIQLRDQNQEDM